jgi:hypothetical protein
MLDHFVIGIFAVILIVALSPYMVENGQAGFIALALAVLAWVFIEALFLATWGTTPGKWIFNIDIHGPAGARIPLKTAFQRSWRVLLFGEGLVVLGPVSLAALWWSKDQLQRKGVTSWDRDLGFTVTHKKLGLMAWIVFSIPAIFLLLTIYALFTAL